MGKSPLGVSSTNPGSENGLGGGGQGYTPTHSCPQSQAGALLCNMYSQVDAAGHPHDFIFCSSFHPDQRERVLIVLGQMWLRAAFVSSGWPLEDIWALCGAVIVWTRGRCVSSSEAALLLAHLPAVAAVLVGGPWMGAFGYCSGDPGREA